ncbi:ABC transporter substrate-binding protein [Azospirillum picis]|uniref:Branched-chain amino acid transport system substrate-binding protein n=1 Tax=Azospirillum picis TaxID=488438 RepID=A0ABU0MN90_9PROT|nr:ABC transporter substrate-binding protein [Azospirillum picis]MBP2301162.1 branched-chain amino acid transport system substrate-binding protein [Azospirillum picis]MDQ0534876.1 branched-chain amino acid transport system substrate-binding protein [Azospirillum picis]
MTAAAGVLGFRPSILRAQAAPLKVAFVGTLSGPGAALGNHMRDGWLAGLARLNNQLGGRAVETLVVDDELKPDVAVSKVRAALERDKVDFVVGVVFSNMLQAIHRPVTESGTFLVTTNAGPSTLAGKGCSPFLFSTSYQNDQPHAAMGQVAQDDGHKRVMVLVPNYQAGKDAVAGFKSRYKGEVVDELYVSLNQLDFSAELAKIAAAKPDAIFTFMPGGLGVNLVRQYRQAGLEKTPFLSAFTVDETTLPAQGDASLGFFTASTWAPNVDNPHSRQFVSAFEAAYGYVPSLFAAHSYDAAHLLDAAIKRTGGDVDDKAALRASLEKADFPSVRGAFRFGANHFPVQDFWLCKAAKRPDGKYQTETVRRVLEADTDAYAASCRLS